MKELDTWDAMQMAFKHYKKDSITVLEFNEWCDKYQDEHPDTYTYICRNDIHHEHDCGRIYWEIRYQKSDILHKQETLKCPCCAHYVNKFPNVEHFEAIKKMGKLMEKWTSK
jgi:hypothetical protein